MLVEQLKSTFGGMLEVRGAEAGMHLAVTFPTERDDVAIATKAAEQGLWLWPISGSYVTKNVRKGFVLGYGNIAAQAMPGAVEKMKAAIYSV